LVIFGRWALWAYIAMGVLVIAAAVAVEHPVFGIALVAVALILAVTGWRQRPNDSR
jgi:hypothetical protein